MIKKENTTHKKKEKKKLYSELATTRGVVGNSRDPSSCENEIVSSEL